MKIRKKLGNFIKPNKTISKFQCRKKVNLNLQLLKKISKSRIMKRNRNNQIQIEYINPILVKISKWVNQELAQSR